MRQDDTHEHVHDQGREAMSGAVHKKLLRVLGYVFGIPFALLIAVCVYALVVTPWQGVFGLPLKRIYGGAGYVEVRGVHASRSSTQKLADPWNATFIECFPKNNGYCHLIIASVMHGPFANGSLEVDDTLYRIVSYANGRLVAVDDHPTCVTSTLTIDIPANSAVLVRKKRPDIAGDKFCDAVDELFETEIIDGLLAIKRMG
jgi:hypothetical protein